jgi:ferritin-like metal-binding protein YciE
LAALKDRFGGTIAFAMELPTQPQEISMAAKKEKNLTDLFEDGLKDIYYAEKKILAALPKMAKATETEELAAAFEKHRTETEQQVERLEEVFQALDRQPKGKKCPGIDGILDEGKEILEQFKGMPALDAGLLAAAQAVEHYEITRYGTLIAWAEKLGLRDAVPLLEETLEEEKNTDKALTKLAETAVNQYAAAAE